MPSPKFLWDRWGQNRSKASHCHWFCTGRTCVFRGLATSFVLFLVIRALAGIGQGAYYGPQYALSTEAFQITNEPLEIAIINSGMALGLLAGIYCQANLF